jgi:hypothetical protein
VHVSPPGINRAAFLGSNPLYTPVIVKYRDKKTDPGIELEDWLR